MTPMNPYYTNVHNTLGHFGSIYPAQTMLIDGQTQIRFRASPLGGEREAFLSELCRTLRINHVPDFPAVSFEDDKDTNVVVATVTFLKLVPSEGFGEPWKYDHVTFRGN
jgi:hypothetical protein